MAEAIPLSSPLSSAPSSRTRPPVTSSQQMNQWKSARELPFELQQHVRIYFEESLFTRALDLLLAVVTSDASSLRNQITVPHPEHIALAATLVIHPLTTTRTTSEEKWNQANAALRLLRLLLKTVGPVNSNLKDSFKFRKLYAATNSDESEESIKHPLANDDSIWNRADDFWAVVGWAMNCSCLSEMYAARWSYWSIWLEFVLDVLEADWRYHLSNQSLSESILWDYVGHIPGDTAQPRRMVRAIFADGSRNSLNEFREIFRRELKGPKQESDTVKKREAVDIDNQIFGDYLVQDDSDDSSENDARTSLRTSTRAASARRITPRASRQSIHSDFEDDATTSPTSTPTLGPPDAINIRLRLMQLLVNVAAQPDLRRSRHKNFSDPTDIFTLFVEFIKPLPLPTFQQITSPTVSTTNTFSRPAHTTLLLLEFLLQRLLETTSATQGTLERLTQTRLETRYLPHAASKADGDANARVSLCVESMLRHLATAGQLRPSDSLRRAVDAGVDRRVAKVKDRRDNRMKESPRDDDAWDWLNESSARMRAVVRRLRD